MSDYDDWDTDDSEENSNDNSAQDLLNEQRKEEAHEARIRSLQSKQNELNAKVALLFKKSRDLKDDIKLAEEPKKQVEANQKTVIATAIREVEQVQKDIQSEINKLSTKTKEIKGATPEVSPTSSVPDAPPMEGGFAPPPPPPPFGGPPPPPGPMIKVVAKKNNPVVKQGPKEPKPQEARLDMGQIVGGAANLKKSAGKTDTTKTPEQRERERQEEIQRYEEGIKRREENIERLIGEVSNLSTALETAKASKGEYEQALEKQNELLGQLKDKKQVLDGKLVEVKAKVGSELEKIDAKRKLEEEEKQRQIEEQRQAEMGVVPDAPPLDGGFAPPPPPPPMEGFGGPPPPPPPSKGFGGPPPPPPPPKGFGGPPPPPPPTGGLQSRVGKKATVNVEETQNKPTPSSSGSGSMDMGMLEAESKKAQARQEALAVRNHLVDKLVDLTLAIGDKDIKDVALDDHQKRLLDEIGGPEGLASLRESLKKGVDAIPKTVSPFDAITKRRGAIASGEIDEEADSTLSMSDVRKNKDKRELKDAVSEFIKSQPENGKKLLAVGKEIQVAEKQEADRKAAEKRIEDERIAAERAIEEAEKQRIAKEKEARIVQEKLRGMGVSEGVVDPTGVRNAESAKVEAIQHVSSKKSAVDRTDDFITKMERELSSGVAQLQEAESSRDLALETLATKKEEVLPPQPTIETETVPVVEGSQVHVEQEVQQTVDIVPPKDEVDLSSVSQNVQQSDAIIEGPKDVEVNNVQEPPKPPDPPKPTGRKITEKEFNLAVGRPQPLSQAEQARADKLGKFNQSLDSLITKAQHLHTSGETKAAAELRQICTKLINAKEDYIHNRNGMDEEKLKQQCDSCTSKENTSELSKSRGIMGALRRMAQAVKDAFSGVSLTEAKKTTMERIQDMKNSLSDLKKDVEPQATGELEADNEHRASIRPSVM